MSTTAEEISDLAAEPKQLRLPSFDGRDVTLVQVAFSGTVELNRHDPDSVRFFRNLKLGRRVDLEVSGVVRKRTHAAKSSEEGGEDTITLAGVQVDSITVGE